MSFAAWTACACLASFAAAGGLASMLLWWAAGREVRKGDARWSAGRLLLLRVLPTAFALAVATGVTLPAFLIFEPRQSGETAGATFVFFSAAGALAIALGLRRGLADWWSSRRLRRDWTRNGLPFSLEGAPVPAYRIRHSFPVVSVVGILRPRLFVAEQVLERLSPAELRAVLAHEAGHVRSADNLKRLLVRLCPLLPWRAAARRIEQRWEQAAEEAADARADAALDLASALIKTARLAPAGARLEMPMASFQNGSSLARRVKLLTARPAPAAEAQAAGRVFGIRAAAAAGVIVALAAALWPQALGLAHKLLETFVHLP